MRGGRNGRHQAVGAQSDGVDGPADGPAATGKLAVDGLAAKADGYDDPSSS